MADRPPQKLIDDVKGEILFASPVRPATVGDLKDGDSLEVRWRLFAMNRAALADPFQRIARDHNAGAVCSRLECQALDTVGAAVTLVVTKAGFANG